MRKKTVLISLILVIIAGSIPITLWFIKRDDPNPRILTEVEEIEDVESFKEIVQGLESIEETYKKMDTFIRERIPASNIFLKFNLIDEESVSTKDDLRTELFMLYFTALKNQDMNLFTAVVSGEAIKEVWDEEINVELRINKIQKVLKNSSRDGKFSTLRYQFEEDKYKQLTDKGVLYLIYTDGIEIQIPFEVELIGEDEHRYYRFVNSIKEMEQLIQNENLNNVN